MHRCSFGLNLNLQRELFALNLDEFAKNGDLTNQLLGVIVKKDSKVELRRLALPADEDA